MISDTELCLISNTCYLFKEKGEKAVIDRMESLGWKNVKVFFHKKTDAEAIIARRGEDVVIAFCATNSLKDILVDSKFNTRKTQMGRIHAGAWDVFCKIKAKLVKTLNEDYKTFDKSTKFYITGRSLGGMMANILSMWIPFNCKGTVESCVTFGEPRSLKIKAKKIYDTLLANKEIKRRVRYRHERDIVTRMFPKTFGYRHVGELYYLDTNGNLIKNPSKAELIVDGIRDILSMPNLVTSFKDKFSDHNSERYYENMP